MVCTILITASNEVNLTQSLDDKDFLEMTRRRKQTEFISIASHEMKVPIQTIVTFCELLQKTPHKGTMYLEPILRNAKRLQRLSRNLLDLSRVENHSLTLNKEIFDLTSLISSIVDDMAQIANKKYQNIKILKPTNTIFVNADKERMSQVLCNVLGNAIKFTADGIISVTTEKDRRQNMVVVSIKDSGLGISQSILPVLFSKFMSTSHDGLGLGLFIAKNIIEAHGGRIWAHNNDDKGATFSFTLAVS